MNTVVAFKHNEPVKIVYQMYFSEVKANQVSADTFDLLHLVQLLFLLYLLKRKLLLTCDGQLKY